MSAMVCGKRSLLDDMGSPPGNKRLRSCANSPVHCAFSRTILNSNNNNNNNNNVSEEPIDNGGAPHLDIPEQLRNLFPDLQAQLIDKVFGASGYNFEHSVKHLTELRAGGDPNSSDACAVAGNTAVPEPVDNSHISNNEDNCAANQYSSASMPESVELVDLLVREMSNATDLENARARAAKFLEFLEKNYLTKTGAIVDALGKENAGLKVELQALLKDNYILKRGVAIQHDRQPEYHQRVEELQQLKQVLAHYQEQIRSLEMKNYALSVHLHKAHEGSSIPGRFQPDVF